MRPLDSAARARAEIARRDPNAWMEFAIRDKRGNPLHQGDIHREFQDHVTEHQHCMIEFHRGAGKTTQVTGRSVWELGNDRNLSITVVCANDAKAKKRLGEIEKNISRNPDTLRVFPDMAIESSNKSQLLLRRPGIARDFSVEAYGVLSSGTGDRTDVLIFDDICDRRNTLTQPGMRRQVKDAYPDWMNLLAPDGRSIYLYTPWHNEDLSQDLKRQGTIPLLRRLVEVEWTALNEPRQFKPVWPEVWGVKALAQRLEEIRPRAFKRDFCGQAVDDSERTIWPEWFKFGPPPFRLSDAVRIQIWDGASPRKTVSGDPDYMAFVDMYASPLHSKIYVADAWRGRGLSPSRQRNAVLSRAKLGPAPSYVVIEQVGESALCALVEEVVVANPAVLRGGQLVPIGTEGKSKEIRAEEYLAPAMEGGQVIFAEKFDPDLDIDALPIKSELVDLQFGDHDDLADCVVYGARIASRLMRLGIVADVSEPALQAEITLF